MEVKEILTSVISVFLIILVGVYGSKRKIISEECKKGLTNILLEITLPLMVIVSFNFSFGEDGINNIIKAFICSFIAFIIAIVVSYIFLIPVKGDKKKVMQFANVFSNCGFVGFPVIESIFGAEGVVYTSIFNMFFTIFLWTYGVVLFSSKNAKIEVKKVLLNPSIIAVIIGLCMMIFDVKLPSALYNSLNIVGSMTTPLSMIIIGCILAKVDFKSIFKEWRILYSCFTKLLIIPGFMLLVSFLIRDNGIVIKTIILLQAMPAAATTSIFAEKFQVQEEFSAILVFVTTLISVVTFPLIASIVV